MKIKLVSFQCYDNIEIDFTNNINLLHGESGAGKSTILRAIFWCLYGSLKDTGPFDKFTRTSVEISIKDITIFRQTRPCLLKVGSDVDDVAQCTINKMFGDKSIFLASSYCPQGSKNSLLEGSNNEKLDILNKLSFYEDPDIINSKIDKFLLSYENSLNIEKQILDRDVERIKKEIDTVNWDNFIPKEDRDFSIETYKEKISVLKDKISKNNKNKFRYDYINNFIKNSVLPVDQKIKSLEKTIEYTKKLLDLKNNNIYKTKQEYDSIEDCKYSKEELVKLLKDQEEYKKTELVTKEYGIQTTHIESEIYILEKKVKDYNMIHEAHQIKNERPWTNLKNYTMKDLEKVERQIEDYRLSKKNLTCPECSCTVRIENDILVKSKNVENVNVQDLNDLKKKILLDLELQSRLNDHNNRIENFKKKYGISVYDTDDIFDISKVLDKLSKLKSLTVFEKPIDSDIKKFLRKKELHDILQKFDYTEEMVNESKCVEQSNYESLVSEYKQLYKKQMDYENYIATCDSLKKELSSIVLETGLETELELLEKDFFEKKSIYSELKEMDRIIDDRENIVKQEERVNSLEEKIKKVKDLRSIANVVEYETLTNTIQTLNKICNDILYKMFDNPICIKIDIEKKVKSTGRSKPGINISVYQKGHEYTSCNSLSGGEESRVSLALTLAMSKMTNSPLLLLDETLGSVGENLRQKCVESIKEINKTVICVDHGIEEGLFDNCVKI